jgi:hypothetical protein
LSDISLEKGELRILGRRHVAIDAEALCHHLESCVGKKVAEVIMNNHGVRLGKEEAEYVRAHNPQATVQQILDILLHSDRISGFGVTKITLPVNNSDPVNVEVENPAITETEGAAKTLTFSYWAGALSLLLGREFEVGDATYDQGSSQLKGRLIAR